MKTKVELERGEDVARAKNGFGNRIQTARVFSFSSRVRSASLGRRRRLRAPTAAQAACKETLDNVVK